MEGVVWQGEVGMPLPTGRQGVQELSSEKLLGTHVCSYVRARRLSRSFLQTLLTHTAVGPRLSPSSFQNPA